MTTSDQARPRFYKSFEPVLRADQWLSRSRESVDARTADAR
jgi:hypothetical protein